jgi:hypothetical protein
LIELRGHVASDDSGIDTSCAAQRHHRRREQLAVAFFGVEQEELHRIDLERRAGNIKRVPACRSHIALNRIRGSLIIFTRPLLRVEFNPGRPHDVRRHRGEPGRLRRDPPPLIAVNPHILGR